MKLSLRSRFSLTIAIVVLLTVSFISVLSNFFINKQFLGYIAKQQQLKTKEMVNNLSGYYNKMSDRWDINSIHTLGMYSLYDGFMIKVYDKDANIIWDAQNHDMSLCANVMKEITERMEERYPELKGEFKSQGYSLTQNGAKVGSLTITYYGPYFLSESDFQFLDVLNTILIWTGIIALVLAICIGSLMAKRITRPITESVHTARRIADGFYEVKISERSHTKELDELTASINHLAITLSRQEQLRKQLTQDVSHELRTPLTAVSMHLEALIEGVWEPTKDRLVSCYEEMERLTKIVKDLENLSRVEKDNLHLNKTKCSLIEITEKVYGNLKIEMDQKEQTLEVTGNGDFVFADKDRMYQVIYNLLNNAVKYTPSKGHIKVGIKETSKEISLSVSDNGVGISKEELPLVFERFYRADKSRNRKTGGAGIGLAIVKSIIMAHGGNVDVVSEQGRGSCFTITLPK